MEKMTNVKALGFVLDNFTLPTEVADKIKAMKESFEKKSANRKPTKTQAENDGYKATILEVLNSVDKPLTVTEIQKESDVLGELSNQKVTAILRLMVENDKTVTKTIEKKKSYFSANVA